MSTAFRRWRDNTTANGSLVLYVFMLLYFPFLYENGWRYVSASSLDFPSFYWAAKLVFVDHLSPYDYALLSHPAPDFAQKVWPYLYPPPSLLLFSAFSTMSYFSAKIVMLGINHIMVLVLLYLFIFRILDVRHALIVIAILVYTLTSISVSQTLNHGQINLIAIVMIALAWYAYKTGRSALLIALPLSLAIVLKTYPLLLLWYFLLKREFKVVTWGIALLASICVLSYWALPEVVWQDWITKVLPHGGYASDVPHLFSSAAYWNQSFNGFFARLFQPNEFSQVIYPSEVAAKIFPYVTAIVVMATASVACLWRRSTQRENEKIDMEFSIILLSIFLLAPLSWEHHLVFTLPAVYVAINHVFSGKFSMPKILWVGISSGVLAIGLPIIKWELMHQGPFILLLSVKLYAVVLLWIYFVMTRIKGTRGVPDRIDGAGTYRLENEKLGREGL